MSPWQGGGPVGVLTLPTVRRASVALSPGLCYVTLSVVATGYGEIPRMVKNMW